MLETMEEKALTNNNSTSKRCPPSSTAPHLSNPWKCSRRDKRNPTGQFNANYFRMSNKKKHFLLVSRLLTAALHQHNYTSQAVWRAVWKGLWLYQGLFTILCGSRWQFVLSLLILLLSQWITNDLSNNMQINRPNCVSWTYIYFPWKHSNQNNRKGPRKQVNTLRSRRPSCRGCPSPCCSQQARMWCRTAHWSKQGGQMTLITQ